MNIKKNKIVKKVLKNYLRSNGFDVFKIKTVNLFSALFKKYILILAIYFDNELIKHKTIYKIENNLKKLTVVSDEIIGNK